MANRQPATPFLRHFQTNSPNSSLGILTFLVSGSVLLLLTGITITVSLLGLVFLAPVLLLTSPLWVPLLITFCVLISLLGTGVGTFFAVSWAYRYFRGLHPVGSDQVDYARNQIVSTASHVKDYAREYMHSKVKDAAPGA